MSIEISKNKQNVGTNKPHHSMISEAGVSCVHVFFTYHTYGCGCEGQSTTVAMVKRSVSSQSCNICALFVEECCRWTNQ